MNRRQLLQGLMAGGIIIAGELWIPGQKLISIPSGQVFGNEYGIHSAFRLIDRNTVEYIGADDKVVNITEFYKWLKKHAAHMMREPYETDSLILSLKSGCSLTNPEHLVNGTFTQDAEDSHGTYEPLREQWTCLNDMSDGDLFTDKVYFIDHATPRLRLSELDNGHMGYR